MRQSTMLLSLQRDGLRVKDQSSQRSLRILLGLSGILGGVALLTYFSAPFWLFPFPAATASGPQVAANAAAYQNDYLLGSWLLGTGSLLIVVFVLGLVYLAEAWTRFSGWITMLACTAVLFLALNQATYFIDIVQASANGHPEAALTSFDLTFVFIYTFFLAPAVLLPLAAVLRGSRVLPTFFWVWALAIGVAFEALGLLGLFVAGATILKIAVLFVQEAWIFAASASLIAYRPNEATARQVRP